MNIKCPKCKQTIHSKIGNHWYKESGLDNVYLKNITVYKCPCGVSIPSIFRSARLDELIAETLLEKPALLDGKEIRFLRKSLYMSSKDFSQRLGIGKTTLSKWENGTQRHREGYDRFIRSLYLLYKGTKEKEKRALLKMYDRIQLKEMNVNYIIIADKEGNDYVVNRRPVLSGRGQKLPTVWISAKAKNILWSVAERQNFALELSQQKSDKMFSSKKGLSTETVPILGGY